MPHEVRVIDASDIPGLGDLAREVRDTREPIRIVGDSGEELAVIQPALSARESLRAKTSRIYTDPAEVLKLTDDEVEVVREAMRQTALMREHIRAAHGGKPLPESWPIIRAARGARPRRP